MYFKAFCRCFYSTFYRELAYFRSSLTGSNPFGFSIFYLSMPFYWDNNELFDAWAWPLSNNFNFYRWVWRKNFVISLNIFKICIPPLNYRFLLYRLKGRMNTFLAKNTFKNFYFNICRKTFIPYVSRHKFEFLS